MYQNRISNEKRRGFSLVEILVGLLIIAVCLAVFAPTMTKKVKKNAASINTKIVSGSKCNNTLYKLPTACNVCYYSTSLGKGVCTMCNLECCVECQLNVATCECMLDSTTKCPTPTCTKEDGAS